MTWATRAMNGTMPVLARSAAEHLRAVDVVGGQVGQGAAAAVVVVDAHRAGLARGQGGVAAAAGLDGGLLVAGDDVLVLAERFAVEGAGVQVQHAGGLGRGSPGRG